MDRMWSLISSLLPSLVPPEDAEQKARREAELRQRLSRLARDVDVIRRTAEPEEPRQ